VKVDTARTSDSQAVLSVQLEAQDMEQWLDRAYRRLVQRVSVPGFRKGKAPRAVLERHVGRERLMEEAIQVLVPEATDRIIQEQALEAVADPEVEVEKKDGKYVEPLAFKATVPLKPTVDLGDYASLRIAPEPVVITDEQVTHVLDQLRWEQAPWVPVERAVQMGDLLVLDIDARVDGRPFLDQKGATHRPIAEVPDPVPGFNERLAGMVKGESREFTIAFPADHPARQWAGRAYAFRVLLHEIKAKKLPDLNDDFAKGVGEGFDTLDKLKERVRENLRATAESAARKRYQDQVVDALVQQAKITYPPLLGDQERELRQSRMTMNDYLERSGKTLDQLREETRPIATRRLVRSLALGKLAEMEKVQVSPGEVDAEIEGIVKGSGDQAERMRQALASPAGRESIERMLLTRRTIQRLEAIARGESAAAAPAEAAAPGGAT